MPPVIKHIVFLVIPEATLLDITGPYEVFSQAIESLQAGEGPPRFLYQLHCVSVSKSKHIRTASGCVIQCPENIHSLDYAIDTLFIPGVPNALVGEYRLEPKVLQWIKGQAGKARRICSVCTGSFFLAEAGLLAGKRVTTHWEKCELLKENYPDVIVDPHPIFVKEGSLYTSAGISSGMDLALALVEEDLGKTPALEVARQMVLYLKRPGNQSQYSSVLAHQHIDNQPIRSICNWIQEHLKEELTVETLAGELSMSPRNFARVFLRETGSTPAKYIDKLRLETACRYLVDTRLSLKEIAGFCGLGSIDTMRKVFLKHLNISPADYRTRFSTAVSAGEDRERE